MLKKLIEAALVLALLPLFQITAAAQGELETLYAVVGISGQSGAAAGEYMSRLEFVTAAVKSENSAVYAYALKKCGVSCELHMYPERVHGFANGYLRQRVWEWQTSCRSWLGSVGVL